MMGEKASILTDAPPQDDVDFDYRKGKPTAFVSEVEAEENDDDDNQDPNTSRRSR